MSIVCPLPSCYLIIVSVAPAVSPSLPSFVSLYSLLVSAVLCWSVVFHVSMSCELNVWLCSSLLPACLFVFPLRGGFCCSFHFIILKPGNLCIWVLDLISSWQNGSAKMRTQQRRGWVAHHPTLSPAPYTNASSSTRPWAPAVSRAMTWGVLPWSSVVQLRARLQWWGPQGPFQQRPWWAPQLVEDEWAGPPHIWGIRRGFGTFPS